MHPRIVRSAALTVLLAAATALIGCGSEGGTTGSTDSGSVEATRATGSLTFTRPDGSTFSVDSAVVRCAPTTTEKKLPAIFVSSASPSRSEPFFQLEAVLADVPDGTELQLPANYIESDPEGAVLFAYDPKTKNELDSTFEDSAGSIKFESASCDPEPQISFSVDGTLDSEFGDLAPNDVQGSFSTGGG